MKMVGELVFLNRLVITQMVMLVWIVLGIYEVPSGNEKVFVGLSYILVANNQVDSKSGSLYMVRSKKLHGRVEIFTVNLFLCCL